MRHFQPQIEFKLYEDVRIEEILEALHSLPPAAVLYTAFSRDKMADSLPIMRASSW